MRFKAEDIRKITARYIIETDDEEVEPITLALSFEFTKEVTPSKELILSIIENMNQALKDSFNKEVE